MQATNLVPVTNTTSPLTQHTRFQVFTNRQLEQIAPVEKLSAEQRFEMKVVANVLPFRVNRYVIDELINWDNVPSDPIFQLVFPQREMLKPSWKIGSLGTLSQLISSSI